MGSEPSRARKRCRLMQGWHGAQAEVGQAGTWQITFGELPGELDQCAMPSNLNCMSLDFIETSLDSPCIPPFPIHLPQLSRIPRRALYKCARPSFRPTVQFSIYHHRNPPKNELSRAQRPHYQHLFLILSCFVCEIPAAEPRVNEKWATAPPRPKPRASRHRHKQARSMTGR